MFFKKKREKKTYDPNTQKPVIKESICTGERVAGFRDLHTGKFRDVMLISSEKDLAEFIDTYGISEKIDTIY